MLAKKIAQGKAGSLVSSKPIMIFSGFSGSQGSPWEPDRRQTLGLRIFQLIGGKPWWAQNLLRFLSDKEPEKRWHGGEPRKSSCRPCSNPERALR